MKGDLNQGQLVGGRYEVVEWINAGGMQNVYLASDRYFDRKVALKSPKEDTVVKRFQQSAAVGALINHPNVAKALDYVEEGQKGFLIEEFVEGCDLSQLIPAILPAVPPATAGRLLHQLARGLAASHRAGVIHRDLKPSNVMISGGLALTQAKITDFGIAKMAEGEIAPWAAGDDKGTKSRTILGAIPYMAPESITDFKQAGKPADVWALAAIVYEATSGVRPFGRGVESIAKILSGAKPSSPPYFAAPQFKGSGAELFKILTDCFVANPADRPTADDLVNACNKLCYGDENYETGHISERVNSVRGWITPSSGRRLMYHNDSFYGDRTHSADDQLWFARHPGGRADRAMPVVKLVKPKK